MDRRRFHTAAIAAPLLAPTLRMRVNVAANGSEVRGTLRRLTVRGFGDNVHPAWSSDGHSIVFASGTSSI